MNKTKCSFTNRRESLDDKSAQARQARAKKRDDLLADSFPMQDGEMVTLQDRKEIRLRA
jgi:hypothetical protein